MGPKTNSKRKRCDDVTIVEQTFEEKQEEFVIKPQQAAIFCEELAPFIHRVYPNPSKLWKEVDISYLGKLMANRGGFDASNKQAINESGISDKLNWFYGEYVNLYESNKEFEKMIDPWYVICDGYANLPGNTFTEALNAANQHMGGGQVAGNEGDPIVFQNGNNWFLHCRSREEALQIKAFLHGRINNANFQTSTIDCRFLLHN